MYPVLLAFHNIVRWIVVFLGIVTNGLMLYGWYDKKQWSEKERKVGLFFTISIDVQLLIGILLYFVFSEWGMKAILERGMSFVMGQNEFRFFAIEHVTYMLFAFVFSHLGSALPKKVDETQAKFKIAAIWYGFALVLILVGIPWSRPLFP